MKPTIYIHIGLNKTGSTSIQNFLLHNSPALLKRGILVPKTGLGTKDEGHGYHYMLTKYLGFSNSNIPVETYAQELQALRSDLDEEIAGLRPKKVIFSSEYFSLKRSLDPFRAFFAEEDVKIIVYLRRHDEWYASLYSQAVKTVPTPKWEPGLDGYVDYQEKIVRRYQTFSEMLEAWASVVGKDNVIVRPFQPQRMPNGLIADFLDACGVTSTSWVKDDARYFDNRSLPMGRLNAIDSVWRSNLNQRMKQEIVRVLILTGQSTDEETGYPALSEDRKAAILAKYTPDYEHIAREYLGRADGVLFED